MTAERPTEPEPKGPTAKVGAVLSSGIPLELLTYGHLATAAPEWIVPDHTFPFVDENGTVKTRSVDFVASVVVAEGRVPSVPSTGVYFIVECKYQPPNDALLLFMPDLFPQHRGVFDDWRPELWRQAQPHAPHVPVLRTEPPTRPFSGSLRDPIGGPRCVKGSLFRSPPKQSDKPARQPDREEGGPPILTTAVHQLRDALHDVATLRFRRFTAMHPPRALVFVPVLVTNAEMWVLRQDSAAGLLTTERETQFSLESLGARERRLLLRCPPGLVSVDWKWKRLLDQHGDALGRIPAVPPAYKRQHGPEFHYRTFFETTPHSVAVVHVDDFRGFLADVLTWVKALQFPE